MVASVGLSASNSVSAYRGERSTGGNTGASVTIFLVSTQPGRKHEPCPTLGDPGKSVSTTTSKGVAVPELSEPSVRFRKRSLRAILEGDPFWNLTLTLERERAATERVECREMLEKECLRDGTLLTGPGMKLALERGTASEDSGDDTSCAGLPYDNTEL